MQQTQSKSPTKLKTLELTSYLDKYGEDQVAQLYVLNRTNPRGNIVFNCLGDLNRPITVTVMATFIPIDLTAQVPRTKLLESPALRRNLARGDLVICDNEDVAALFASSSRAKEEFDRLHNVTRTNGNSEVELDTNNGVFSEEEDTNADFVSEIIERSIGGDTVSMLQDMIYNRIERLSKTDVEQIANGVSDPELKRMCLETIEQFM